MFFDTDKNTVHGANKLASCLSIMCGKLMRQFLKYQEQLDLGSRVHFKLLLNIIYMTRCDIQKHLFFYFTLKFLFVDKEIHLPSKFSPSVVC